MSEQTPLDLRVCPKCRASKPPAQQWCFSCRNPPDPEVVALRALVRELVELIEGSPRLYQLDAYYALIARARAALGDP